MFLIKAIIWGSSAGIVYNEYTLIPSKRTDIQGPREKLPIVILPFIESISLASRTRPGIRSSQIQDQDGRGYEEIIKALQDFLRLIVVVPSVQAGGGL